VSEYRQQVNREPREHDGFVAWIDDGHSFAGAMCEQTCGGARAGDGKTNTQSAIRGGPTERRAHRARIPKQARQAAEINRDLSRTVHLDARRELERDLLHGLD
jgi:hypothetical protein